MAKIFVVDDDLDICFVIKHWLTLNGHAVESFDDDATLMDRIIAIHPDIIFLDINLHGKDGREVCKEIKEVTPEIVIILFSANPSALMDFKECAADDSFSKPFAFSLLNEKINKFMKQQSQKHF